MNKEYVLETFEAIGSMMLIIGSSFFFILIGGE